MSIIKGVAGGTRSNNSERFFGEVVGYDLAGETHTVTVKHTVTGEIRKVAMDPESQNLNIKEGFSRPEIADFAKKGKNHTAIGGVLRIEDAYPDRSSGTWMARWANCAVPAAGEGLAVVAKEARVSTLKERAGGGDYRFVDVLAPEQAVRTNSKESLIRAIEAAIGSHNSAFIRMAGVDDNGNDAVKGMMLSGGRPERPLPERIERALSGEGAKLLLESMANGPADGDVVEVVPAERIFFGGDSAKSAKLDRNFTVTEETRDGERIGAKGFGEVLLSIRVRDDGSKFVIGAIPSSRDTAFLKLGAFDTTAAPKATPRIEVDDDLPPDIDLSHLAAPAAPSM